MSWSQRESETTSLRSRLIRSGYFLALILSLILWAWLRSVLDLRNQPSWLPVDVKILQFIVDAFFATFIAAVVLRLIATRLVEVQVISILSESVLWDSRFLARLNNDVKETALKQLMANLVGHEFATTLYNAFISPYIGLSRLPLRESRRYDVRVEEAKRDWGIPIGETTKHTLPREEYCSLETRDVFAIPLTRSVIRSFHFQIILSFTDTQLNEAFKERACVFRELLHLSDHERSWLCEALDTNAVTSESVLAGTDSDGLALECKVSGNLLKPDSLSYDARVGIRVKYKLPHSVVNSAESVEFDIHVRVPYSRSRARYPVIYAEPTRVWLVTMDVNLAEVSGVGWEAMFTTSAPQQPTVQQRSSGRIEMSLGGQWVLPTSGIVFFW